MINLRKKTECCGCTACYSICPQNCIEMVPDEEGFLYPKVNITGCINCKLCERVCPELNGFKKQTIKESFALRSRDKIVLETSTSGGFFTGLAAHILKCGGSIFGVICDDKNVVRHYEVSHALDSEKVELYKGSKYVQSHLGDTFSRVDKLLKEDRLVLFSGTPCQIAGLRNFLIDEYDKLITVEVICHGTSSPLLWEKYVELQERKHHSSIKKVNFRNKTYGYHSGTMFIEFDDGATYIGSARVDLMLKSFFSEISSRPSCYNCICKGESRPADISIFDCWHANELVSGLEDDDRGYTNVFINSKKGIKVYQEIQNCYISYSTEASSAIKKDGIMITEQPEPHPKRNEFYKTLNSDGIENAVNKYLPISMLDVLIERSKGILCKTGLMKKLREIKKI